MSILSAKSFSHATVGFFAAPVEKKDQYSIVKV